MGLVGTKNNLKLHKKVKIFRLQHQSFEVAIVEDNKLINLILSNELGVTINKIRSSKNYSIKFSSFSNGNDFLSYLENREAIKSKLIVFSDYYLEEDMNGGKILKEIKRKGIDATVVIMSDTTNNQTSIETVKMGAVCFIPKDSQTPFVCSQMLTNMVS